VKTSVQRFPDDRSAPTQERRRTDRVELMVRVDYKTVDELFSEFARNINEGGMFVETDAPPEPGSPVALQFRIPGSPEPIAVMGRVVRTTQGDRDEPPGMGIEFENLDAQSRDLINQLVRGLRVGAGD
jgi:type IV pilus assembly protein PilZ